MGIDWDEEVVYQSRRADRHQSRAESLVEAGKAYRCYYLPEELEAKKRRPWRRAVPGATTAATPTFRPPRRKRW